jgi:hypothetical protein
MATLRDTAIGLLRVDGHTNIAKVLRDNAHSALSAVPCCIRSAARIRTGS